MLALTTKASIAPRQRDGAVDALKAIAIFSVLTIHAAAPDLSLYPLLSSSGLCALFWASLVRFAVPVFFLCSGALMLRADKPLSLSALFGRYLPRLLIALFFWAGMYELFSFLAAGCPEGFWLPALKRLVLWDHHFHLYFIHIMLLVYLLLPLTRLFVAHASPTLMRYALMIWAALAVLYPTLRPFWPLRLLSGIPAQYALNLTWGAVGYTLLGHALGQAKKRPRLCWAFCFLSGFAIAFGMTLWLSLRQGQLYAGFLEGMSPGVCLMAVGLFGYLRQYPPRSHPLLAAIAKLSFGVYLVHDFFNILLSHFWPALSAMHPLYAIPLQVLLVFTGSIAVCLLLHKIPLVNRYLL